ncbi:hypothetical protein ACGF8B_37855 [Streptomyces sp. NPDC047917]|uniref:hypothetical protein n=1 Tax=Streptomyces sp. NPDC047917 TaxID=3365491 RepID=UPI00371CBA33
MPTYESLPRSTAERHRLTPEQRRRLRQTVTAFVHDPRAEGRFRAGLRVKHLSGFPGIHELTWSMGTGPAGRATWSYGPERKRGAHIVWRRIGTHDIFTSP